MEFFRRGICHTYKYELVNEDMTGKEGVFGLLRYDLSEKPSFWTVKNLIALLNDKGPSFEPGTLSCTLNSTIDNVRQLLFQKRNGDFYLAIWMEIPSWNISTRTDLYPAPQPLVLTLQDSRKISSATLYAFNNNANMDTNLTISNNRINFNATDKISIMKLGTQSYIVDYNYY